MFNCLRRWHFDLALFLGLAIFSWAYWYTKPRPVWTSCYTVKHNGAGNDYLTLLGYSADCQLIYTSCETTEHTKNWPIPQIQRWSTRTGELLEDYPVAFPVEDHFLLQRPGVHYGSSFTTTLCADPRYFMVRYEQSDKMKYHYIRLYRIDGTPIGQGWKVNQTDIVELLPDPTGGDRHWIAQFNRITPVERKTQFELTGKKTELPISVIDVDTGQLVRPPQIYAAGRLDSFPKIVGGRHLVVKMEASAFTPMQLEVIDMQTGESQGCITLVNHFNELISLDNTHYALVTMIGTGDSFASQINYYRYDSVTRAIQPDHTPPLDGITSAPMQWLRPYPPYLVGSIGREEVHQQHQVIKTLLSWLARIGINRNDTHTSQHRIFDMTTGQLLRQISGFPQDVLSKPSPDWRSFVALATGPNDLPGLCLYVIPHYLWETTLSWMQWLSWLLVLPWPLRYYAASRQNSLVSNTTA